MADPQKTVFISYRRNVSSFIARAIFMDLRAHGYDVFMDVESIDAGEFDRIILGQIAARAHFLVIL
ncbi:MAG: toll/interleukin-1 receptor domain-containing protein, partial [Anaerolineae bacterium]|nr:toll/interleukin-1 receptor domain-containing protein [Anaerolineae bacterium]